MLERAVLAVLDVHEGDPFRSEKLTVRLAALAARLGRAEQLRALTETGSSAGPGGSALTAEHPAARPTGSASSVFSEGQGERQGRQPVSVSARTVERAAALLDQHGEGDAAQDLRNVARAA